MFQRIAHLWLFLWKSRIEKKTELARSSLEAFETLAVIDQATKQEVYPYVKDLYDYVKDLYDDLMEINVLQFKVNFIAVPLTLLFMFIVWFFVLGLIVSIPAALLSFFFSGNPNDLFNIQPFLDAQIARNGYFGVVIGLVFLFLYFVVIRWLFGVSAEITFFLFNPIISAYVRFFERLRDTRYPVASLVDKLIWLLYYAERHHMQERLGVDVRPLVTVVKRWRLNSKQKANLIILTPLCIFEDYDHEETILYLPGLITEREAGSGKLLNVDFLSKPTTSLEEAYRAIETAVCKRRLTIEQLAPINIPKKKGGKKKEKPKSRMKALIGYKQQQTLLLEGAARCLERYVPRQLRGGDAVTDYWLQETFQLAAAALREKKTWILTPKMDTYDYFTKSITSSLICALNDDWDALERVEMEELMKRQKLARSQLWRFRLIILLRAVFVAILPVVGFIILQLTPLAIAGATRTYVIVGLFIWVGLSVLALLDSDLEKKLGMANTIKSLLSLPGKNGP